MKMSDEERQQIEMFAKDAASEPIGKETLMRLSKKRGGLPSVSRASGSTCRMALRSLQFSAPLMRQRRHPTIEVTCGFR